MTKNKFYSADEILKRDAQYNLIISERSNGKTYCILNIGLKKFFDSNENEQMGIIRRWDEDFKGKNGANTMFDALIENGLLKKYSKGKYNNIYYYAGKWYACLITDDGKRQLSDKPIAYAFAISQEEHYKSTSYPNITTILFDEFLTRSYYLIDEFIKYQSLLSTIIRLRTNVKIFMCGNTINKFCPYFAEMGLTNIKKMNKGDIDLYTYGDTGLRVAVEYAGFDTKNKKSNVYFAFDNPKLKMITSGEWEISIYPHLPCKYSEKDIIYTYYIKFDDYTLQCEIISKNNDVFTFIHYKTTPIKEDYNTLIYTTDYNVKPYYRRNIIKPFTKLEKKILEFYAKDKIFYQNNDIGEIIRNYLLWCKNNC